jgi:DNA-binding beta-propeller fold protein YncE
VVNEGGFSGGGSLSFYDEQRDTIFNGIPEGGTDWVFPNDMKIVGGRGYVAVNGSDRVDVLDPGSNRIVRSIHTPPFTGPGYLAVSGSALFVANYNGTLSVIATGNDSLRQTTARIVTFPGGIASAGGKVFVSDYGTYVNGQFAPGHYVKVVVGASVQLADSIRTSDAPGAMAVLNGKLFVVCGGTQSVRPWLYQLDPGTDRAEDSIRLSGAVSDIATDGRDLFVLSTSGVAKLADRPLRVIQSPFISRGGGLYFYALGVNESNGEIYLTNIVSPGGSGRLEIYSSLGIAKRLPLPAGIFPGAFAFK